MMDDNVEMDTNSTNSDTEKISPICWSWNVQLFVAFALLVLDTELYPRFLRHVFPIICNLNAEFQAETPRIHVLYSRMSELCQTLLKCYIKADLVLGAI